MTATSQIAQMKPSSRPEPSEARRSGETFSLQAVACRGEKVSPLRAFGAPVETTGAPGANAGKPEIAYRVENTASDASVTAPPQMPEMAPISPDWRHLAESFCRLGATEEQLADLFSVSPQTIAGWMSEIPDFADAVRRGRNMADAYVADSLHRLAVGYSHTVERVFKGGRDGPVTVSYLKHYPPHSQSCMKWLVNRRPDLWGRAAIKRKLQDWEDERDAAARRLPLLSDAALAALVLAEEQRGCRNVCHPERSEGSHPRLSQSTAQDPSGMNSIEVATTCDEMLRCAQHDMRGRSALQDAPRWHVPSAAPRIPGRSGPLTARDRGGAFAPVPPSLAAA